VKLILKLSHRLMAFWCRLMVRQPFCPSFSRLYRDSLLIYGWMNVRKEATQSKDFKYFHRHECKERPDSLGVSVDWMKIKTNCCNRVLLLDRFHDARHIYQTICKLKTLPVCFIGSWSIILAILPISSDVPCGEGVIPFLFFHHDEEVLQNTLKLIDNVECIYLG